MIKYIVEVRMWFDKINGNTYHRVIVLNTNKKLVFDSGFVYGYGEQYRHTAFDGLIKLGLMQETDRFNHEKNREEFIFVVKENCKKKELIGD